jgi:GTP-binding protein EngB required for normal cell division
MNVLSQSLSTDAKMPNGNSQSVHRESSICMINRVADICRRFEINTLTPQVEACQKLIGNNEMIDVVVLGNFKAGKSSFLNSLAGAAILPVGVVPVTAIITRLRYGESVRASVQFLDGRSQQVPLTDVKNYIAESQNPANAKRVADVLIETPALKSYAGLQFIDTPGLNSIFTHNSETSRNWLPNVGAALLAISADHPFSEQDAALLKELLRFTPKVTILLTKVDLLSAEQIDEVKNFICQQIDSIVANHISFFTYSIREETNSRREILDNELLLPLARSRISESESILQHKLKTLLADLLNYLKIGLVAATKDESNRAWLREQILGGKNNQEAVAEELRLIERDCLGRTRSQVDEIIERHQARLQRELLAELRTQLSAWNLNLWKLSRAYESWLGDALKQKVLAVSSLERDALAAPLQKAERRFSRAVENFKNSLSANVERTLGIKMASAAWQGKIKSPERADISISPAFDIHIDSLWFLLPMPLIKRWVHRHFLRSVFWEVEKNLSRLASQWTDAVDTRIRDLKQQAKIYAATEIRTIENLLARQSSQIPQFEQARNELLELQRLLETGVNLSTSNAPAVDSAAL